MECKGKTTTAALLCLFLVCVSGKEDARGITLSCEPDSGGFVHRFATHVGGKFVFTALALGGSTRLIGTLPLGDKFQPQKNLGQFDVLLSDRERYSFSLDDYKKNQAKSSFWNETVLVDVRIVCVDKSKVRVTFPDVETQMVYHKLSGLPDAVERAPPAVVQAEPTGHCCLAIILEGPSTATVGYLAYANQDFSIYGPVSLRSYQSADNVASLVGYGIARHQDNRHDVGMSYVTSSFKFNRSQNRWELVNGLDTWKINEHLRGFQLLGPASLPIFVYSDLPPTLSGVSPVVVGSESF